ncbi:MAG: hypothetical protein FWF84_07970, partial [Kiritimatiellaeota bacterium]|nr:hypothetical protein [Kiritimatiellota bacterium]
MKRMMVTVLAVACLGLSLRAEWIGPATGSTWDADHDYLNADNWEGGVIDNLITNCPGMGSWWTLYFTNDWTVTGDFRNVHFLNQHSPILKGQGGDYTVTLNGDFYHYPSWSGDHQMHFGSNSDGSRLFLHLPAGEHRFFIATNDTGAVKFETIPLWIYDPVTGPGDLIKEGPGQLRFLGGLGNPTFTGNLVVNEGIMEARPKDAPAGSFYVNEDAVLSLGDIASFNPMWDGQRIVVSNGVIRGAQGGYGAVRVPLLAHTPIIKDGSCRMEFPSTDNVFSNGFVVKQSSVYLTTPDAQGVNVAGNDFIADGGFIVLSQDANNLLGSEQRIVVNTLTNLSGVGIAANIPFPAFETIGDGVGVLAFEPGAPVASDLMQDPSFVQRIEEGWYLGTSEGTVSLNPPALPQPRDFIYRLGSGRAAGRPVIAGTNLLTGGNSVLIGSVTHPNGTSLAGFTAPQDFTGTLLLPGAPDGGTMEFLLSGNGAITQAKAIRVAPNGRGHADFKIDPRIEGRFLRMAPTVPLILEGEHDWRARLFIAERNTQISTNMNYNEIGPVVLRSGRGQIQHGNPGDQYVQTAFCFFQLEA